MAESVERRMEGTIHELEQMEKLKLFDKVEIKAIIDKKRELENKLHRQTKSKEDYISYIQYEMQLMKTVAIKKQKNCFDQKKLNIEYSIANRVNKLYNEVIRRYPGDVLIWLSYVKFCKQVRFYTSASRVFHQLLDLHGKDKPHLYKLAAKWELEECNSIEKARKYLQNGLHIHKDSRILYIEAFKLELIEAQRKRAELKDSSDMEFEGHCAKIIYLSAVRQIPDVTLLVELLEIAKQYDFTINLQKKIISDMKDMFGSDELTWDTVAKFELERQNDPKVKLKERIRNCDTVYKKYVKTLNTERMWSMYLDTLLDLNKDQSTYPILKKKLLSSALLNAHVAEKLSEKYYSYLAEQLGSDTSKKLSEILQQATCRLSHSVAVWEMRLQNHLSRGEESIANIALEQATNALGPNALSLWKLMLLYYQSKNSRKVDELFANGTKSSQYAAIANPLKVLYLERLAVTKGIVPTRKAYKTLAQTPPLCLELHKKMIELEMFQPDPIIKHIQSCYALACMQFGTSNPDIWTDYINFELNYGDKTAATKIYLEARNKLKKPLDDNFL